MGNRRTRSGVESARFRWLWAGSGVSELGTAISNVAFPLLALTRLGATALQVGVLTAAENAGWFLIGLPAGIWMDRWDKRRALVRADLGRVVLLGSVPIVWWLGDLTIWYLIAMALTAGLLSVIFNVGWPAYLPDVVRGEEALVAANTRLTTTTQAGGIVGPGLGGVLVQALSGAGAIGLDACSYAWSAWCLRRTATRQPPPSSSTPTAPCQAAEPARGWQRMRIEVGDGFRAWWRDPLLRRFTLYSTQVALFLGIFNAVVFVFLERSLHLNAGVIGVLMAASGIGGVLGGLLVPRLRGALGTVRALQLGAALLGIGGLALPLASRGIDLAYFVAGFALATAGLVTFNIIGASLRQSRVPLTHLGRVVASTRLLSWGVIPVGSVIGGAMATVWSARGALWVAAVGWGVAVAWLLRIGEASQIEAPPAAPSGVPFSPDS